MQNAECKMQSGAELPGHSALFILHSALEMVGMKGIAPPRLPDSDSGPSAIRV